jgi:hypothetical protein
MWKIRPSHPCKKIGQCFLGKKYEKEEEKKRKCELKSKKEERKRVISGYKGKLSN